MPNRHMPDAIPAAFRDLRAAVDVADGRAEMTAIEHRPDLDGDEVLASELTDEHLRTRPDRALGGRGAVRRFRDELAEVSDELARFYRFSDGCRRGRARQWLAESGLRPSAPVEPASPGRPDLHAIP